MAMATPATSSNFSISVITCSQTRCSVRRTMGLSRTLQRLSEQVNTLMEKLLLVAGVAIAIVLFAQVLARYLGASLSWSEEVGGSLLVGLTFLGAPVATKRAP